MTVALHWIYFIEVYQHSKVGVQEHLELFHYVLTCHEVTWMLDDIKVKVQFKAESWKTTGWHSKQQMRSCW